MNLSLAEGVAEEEVDLTLAEEVEGGTPEEEEADLALLMIIRKREMLVDQDQDRTLVEGRERALDTLLKSFHHRRARNFMLFLQI